MVKFSTLRLQLVNPKLMYYSIINPQYHEDELGMLHGNRDVLGFATGGDCYCGIW